MVRGEHHVETQYCCHTFVRSLIPNVALFFMWLVSLVGSAFLLLCAACLAPVV